METREERRAWSFRVGFGVGASPVCVPLPKLTQKNLSLNLDEHLPDKGIELPIRDVHRYMYTVLHLYDIHATRRCIHTPCVCMNTHIHTGIYACVNSYFATLRYMHIQDIANAYNIQCARGCVSTCIYTDTDPPKCA